jgi:CheY-like chemotaxis protein
MDGLEATRNIRSFKNARSETPIIALTANAMKGDDRKCIDAGMNDYVSKPFKPEDLYSKIVTYVKNIDLIDPKKSNQETLTKKEISETKSEKDDDSAVLYDLTALRDMAGGDESFVLQMLERFHNDIPSALEELNECATKGDWKKLGEVAHKLKPSLLYLGISKTKKAILKIQENEKEENKENTVKLVNQIVSNTKKALDQIKIDHKL